MQFSPVSALLSATQVLSEKTAASLVFFPAGFLVLQFLEDREQERYLGCSPNPPQGTDQFTQMQQPCFLDFFETWRARKAEEVFGVQP